jgi:L-2,4-diaminobutyrate decarboxylase
VYHPGVFTLETSRAGTGALAALASLRLMGREGLRATIGHVVEMTQLLREHLDGHEATTVLNRDNFGTVTIFRVWVCAAAGAPRPMAVPLASSPGGDSQACRFFAPQVYPPGVDTFTYPPQEFADSAHAEGLRRHNEYNRAVARYLHQEAIEGRGVMISFTECYRPSAYGEPIVGLKSYLLSPFVDEEHVALVVAKVLEARDVLAGGRGGVAGQTSS